MSARDPSSMRPEERRREIGELFAAVYLRLLARRNEVDRVAESEPHGAVVDDDERQWAFAPSTETETR